MRPNSVSVCVCVCVRWREPENRFRSLLRLLFQEYDKLEMYKPLLIAQSVKDRRQTNPPKITTTKYKTEKKQKKTEADEQDGVDYNNNNIDRVWRMWLCWWDGVDGLRDGRMRRTRMISSLLQQTRATFIVIYLCSFVRLFVCAAPHCYFTFHRRPLILLLECWSTAHVFACDVLLFFRTLTRREELGKRSDDRERDSPLSTWQKHQHKRKRGKIRAWESGRERERKINHVEIKSKQMAISTLAFVAFIA